MGFLTEWLKRAKDTATNALTLTKNAVDNTANGENSNVAKWLNSATNSNASATQNAQTNNELQKTVATNNEKAANPTSNTDDVKISIGDPSIPDSEKNLTSIDIGNIGIVPKTKEQNQGSLPDILPSKNGNGEGVTVSVNNNEETSIAPKAEVIQAQTQSQEQAQSGTSNQTQTQEQTQSNDTNNDTSSFESWYKSSFGKDYDGSGLAKTDDISDKDYEIGNNLYQSYLQQQNLKKQYDTANQALDASKAQQRQEASILRDKMAKYLAAQNKNSGMDNLGVAQSLNLQADAQYANNLGAIESDINSQKLDLENNYMTNKTNLQTTEAENNQSILNKYQEYARADEQTAYDRAQDEYNKQKYEEEQEYQKAQDEYEKQKYEDETKYNREQDEYEKQKYEEQFEYQKQQDELDRQEAAEEREYERTKTDQENAAVIAQTNIEDAIAEGDYDKAQEYLEANKDVLGDETYKAYEEQAKQEQKTKMAETKQSQTDAVNTFLDSYSSSSESREAYNNTLADLEEKHDEGLLSDEDYNELKSQMEACTSSTCNTGWRIDGLGTGRKNDDIDITIGSTSKGGDGKKVWDLLCGDSVDTTTARELNKLATGNEDTMPSHSTSWFSWIGGDEGSSENMQGKLVVLRNQMYICTYSGWRVVESDHDDVKEAIKYWKEQNQT